MDVSYRQVIGFHGGFLFLRRGLPDRKEHENEEEKKKRPSYQENARQGKECSGS